MQSYSIDIKPCAHNQKKFLQHVVGEKWDILLGVKWDSVPVLPQVHYYVIIIIIMT
jgi:hypothetical protein